MTSDRDLEAAAAMGRKNSRTLILAKNWCAHIRMTRFGGGGMIEQMTGDPIGHLGLECDHAGRDGMSCWDLADAAIDFYDRHCSVCTVRKPVGLPNLSELIGERERQAAERAREEQRLEAEATAALAERQQQRDQLKSGLSTLSATIVDDIGDFDADRSEANFKRLTESARLAPEHFPQELIHYVLDLARVEEWFRPAALAMLRQLGLFGAALVAIDGSKFKAVNTRDRNFTAYKVKRRIEQVAEHIAGYLQDLDTADRQEGEAAEARSGRLVEKIDRLRAQMAMLKAMEAEVEASPDGQVSLTDPDARAMATSGRGSGIVGYNVQSAVEGEHHLIVAHDVVMTGLDKHQLASMAGKAKDAMGVEALDVLADRGYFTGEEILACEALGVTPYLPKPQTSGAKAAGRFGKQDFLYQADQDAYRCPAGALLPRHMTTVEKGLTLHRYWDRASCTGCRLKPRCTPSVERRITRWEHEAVIEALQARMDLAPRAMRTRRRLVEHPFGTIKAWMGHTHFLMKRLSNVKTEISLHILAYNMKRVMAVLGTKPLMEAIRA